MYVNLYIFLQFSAHKYKYVCGRTGGNGEKLRKQLKCTYDYTKKLMTPDSIKAVCIYIFFNEDID